MSARSPLRVVVVGAGAVGSFLGGTLGLAGHDVTLLARRPAGGDARGELCLEDPEGTRTARVSRVHDPDAVAGPDLVILAVKAFDLEGALGVAGRWPGAVALTVQNGVGAEAMASSARGGRVLAGSLTSAVEPIPGGVRRLRTGGIGLAVVGGPDEAEAGAMAMELAGSWAGMGLPARIYPDADAMKWSKLLANLVANATSAILDLDPGTVYADRAGYGIERRQLREAVAVMRALRLRPLDLPGASVSLLLRGLALPEVIGRPLVARAIGRARGGKSPSLRLHVRAGGGLPTEAPWLNGAVALAGRRTGVATPVNAGLARLVEEVAGDPARASHFAGRPDRLLAELVARGPGGDRGA